jgi:hypothetical protein
MRIERRAASIASVRTWLVPPWLEKQVTQHAMTKPQGAAASRPPFTWPAIWRSPLLDVTSPDLIELLLANAIAPLVVR